MKHSSHMMNLTPILLLLQIKEPLHFQIMQMASHLIETFDGRRLCFRGKTAMIIAGITAKGAWNVQISF